MLDNLLIKTENSQAIDFMIETLQNTREAVMQRTILSLLRSTEAFITKTQKKRLSELLLSGLDTYEKQVYEILLLTKEIHLFEKEVIVHILRKAEKILDENNGKWLFWNMILEYSLADDFIDSIVDNMIFKDDNWRDDRHNIYSVRYCINTITKLESLKKVNTKLKKCEENITSLADFVRDVDFEKIISVFVKNYKGNEKKIFNEIFKLLLIFKNLSFNNVHKETTYIINFFIQTDTTSLFYSRLLRIYQKDNLDKYDMFYLLSCGNATIIELCAKDFINKKLDPKYLYYYRNMLAQNGNQKIFEELINARLDNYFVKSQTEYEQEKSVTEEYRKQQFRILLDKQLFIDELRRVFGLVYESRKNKATEKINRNDLYEMRFEKYEQKRLNLKDISFGIQNFTIRILNDLVFKKSIHVTANPESLEMEIANLDEDHQSFMVMKTLVDAYQKDRDKEVIHELLPKIQAWCEANYDLLHLEKHELYYSGIAYVIRHLHEKDIFIPDNEVLLNLLYFHTSYDNHNYINKIVEKVGLQEVIGRIRENLSSPTIKNKMLSFNLERLVGFYAHFLAKNLTDKQDKDIFANLLCNWILETKEREVYPFIYTCVKVIIDFQPTQKEELEKLLEYIQEHKVEDSTHKCIVEALVKRKSTKVKNYLLEQFKFETEIINTETELVNENTEEFLTKFLHVDEVKPKMVKLDIAFYLAQFKVLNAWEYLCTYAENKTNNLSTFNYLFTDMDLQDDSNFLPYYHRLFTALINNLDCPQGIFLRVYLNYATTETIYQSILNYIETHLTTGENKNVSSFLAEFKRNYAKNQATKVSITEIMHSFFP